MGLPVEEESRQREQPVMKALEQGRAGRDGMKEEHESQQDFEHTAWCARS